MKGGMTRGFDPGTYMSHSLGPGGRVETWLEWGLEFPVIENVKGVLDKSD